MIHGYSPAWLCRWSRSERCSLPLWATVPAGRVQRWCPEKESGGWWVSVVVRLSCQLHGTEIKHIYSESTGGFMTSCQVVLKTLCDHRCIEEAKECCNTRGGGSENCSQASSSPISMQSLRVCVCASMLAALCNLWQVWTMPLTWSKAMQIHNTGNSHCRL